MKRHVLVSIVLVSFLLLPHDGWAQEKPSIPRGADGKPDFSGIWQTLTAAEFDLEPHSTRKDAPPGQGIIEGQFIPYRPEALQQRKRNFETRATNDPRSKCFTLGTPRGIYSPEPFQIFQRARDLTLVFQFGHSVRTISTNETRHPKGPIGFWLGDSRGRWEGDSLVVDVVDFNGETWLDRAGNFHSDQLHVVERWSFLDANTIEYRATLEDPSVYKRPWTLSVTLHRHREPNFQLIENYCYTLDYDKSYPVPARASSDVTVLTRAEIDALLAQPSSVLLIDVRRPDEISSIGGFPVYLNIQAGDLETRLPSIPRDRVIITVSNHAARARRAADLLQKNGFNVAGAAGAQDYEAEGGALVKVAPPQRAASPEPRKQ